jgi:hypothetical protein
MSGWNPAKVSEFRSAFLEFANHVSINSKELGPIILGEHIYTAQRLLLDGICGALAADIHDIKAGKSRQLGVSTFSRALTTFWAGMHDGLRGYMVFDTDGHKEEARIELLGMIEGLPRKLGFPKIKRQNRTLVELSNSTIINFAAAGVREGKGSGTLGRSSGINFVHASEICSWAAGEQIEAFRNALAEDFENRLYLWESTARGFNLWYDIYQEAKKDDAHQRCVFIGWWAKDNQRISVNHPDYERYGVQPPTDKELHRIKEVRELYGWQITDEQLAWIRRKMDPTATAEGDSPAEYDGGVMRLQEQPWTEEDMWQVTGSQFFQAETLTDQANKNVVKSKSSHMFGCGMEFVDTKVYPAPNTRLTELRVWEEPEPRDAVYVVAADPAFGMNEDNDRSAIQVTRCYADGIDQVAEYAWPLISTRQFAWVILALAGWYSGTSNEVYLIIELNGPGAAVWDEIVYLKTHLPSGYQQKELDAVGLRDVMKNVRSYIYSRPDSMSTGKAWMWKCLSVYEKLPTPFGWTTMGDVMPDDILIDDQGNECSVVFTSEVKIGNTCYRVTFDDKTSIVADAEHLWPVSRQIRKTGKYIDELVTTESLDPLKHRIAVAKPIILGEANLLIDPYVLGVWLGDGASVSGKIHCGINDAEEISGLLMECGREVGRPTPEKKNNRVVYMRVVGLTTEIRSIGVFGNKHIPSQYLRASKEQRLSLLQGLMDTDGNVNKSGRHGRQCYFTTSSPKMAAGFAELLRSLGFKSKHTIRNRTVRYKGRDVVCAPAWQFFFMSYKGMPVFRLERKRSRCDGGATRERVSKTHRIVSVDKIDSVPVRCIQVDSPSSLYLAGEGMIPTHNTNAGAGPSGKVRLMERLRDFVSNGMLRIRSLETLGEMKSVTREGDNIETRGRRKDDRVVSLALAVRCWEERVRRAMAVNKRTREAEKAKKSMSIVDMASLYSKNQLESFFSEKRRTRFQAQSLIRRASWRNR